MSTTVIPLAGPDFYTPQFGIRPLYPIAGSALIEHVLPERPWIKNACKSDQIIFVLRDEQPYTDTLRIFLKKRFPQAHTVVLSDLTAGAPFSALAAVALIQQHDMPIIVDLADIGFHTSLNVSAYFQEHATVDGIIPYFNSNNPKFSYLALDGCHVIQTREKEVISEFASAGVYCFRDTSTYLRAMNYAIANPSICKIGASFFVCPMLNGLIVQDRTVHAVKVTDVEPVSTLFSTDSTGTLK